MIRPLIIVAVILLVIFAIWFVLDGGRVAPPPPPDPPQRRYKSILTHAGTVPMKLLVMMPEDSALYREPNASSPTGTRLGSLTIWYPFEEKNGFTRIGKSPLIDETIGWIKSSEVARWTTKEGLRPNDANRERPSFDLWSDRRQAGRAAPDFLENRYFEILEPYPVLAAEGGQYQVAMLSQNAEADELRVVTPWTAKIRVPDDAVFSYLTTREELDRDITDLTTALLELRSGGSAHHPVARFLKKYVDIVVDRDIVSERDDVNWMRKMLREMRGPESMSGLQEADLQRDAEKINNRLQRMKKFYNTREVWNERGQAWLPSELLPSN